MCDVYIMGYSLAKVIANGSGRVVQIADRTPRCGPKTECAIKKREVCSTTDEESNATERKILEVQHPNIVGLVECIASEDACTRYRTHGHQVGEHSTIDIRGVVNCVGEAVRLWLEPDRHGAKWRGRHA